MSNAPSLDALIERPFQQVLEEKYFSYALSTITSRSLPDVRDGLKPVHRRILFAMMQLRLQPASSPKKSARIVGDVMGRFHPHGDQAIYDSLVRLAQEFSLRYPLVEGQGNFGSIDGDHAAAMRYTESRLTPTAMLMLKDLEDRVVPFRQTYDASDEEPTVLPAGFPQLLANGAEGIAVGMACAIPPHNVAECCRALRHLLEYPEASSEELMAFIQGPDFPTGGVLRETEAHIRSVYAEGRGSLTIEARWHTEPFKTHERIVVTEIPYQVTKSRIIEQLAQLIEEKKNPWLGDVRDESDAEIRLIIEPKHSNIPPEVLMASLYKSTSLSIRYHLNMNVLSAQGIPSVMSIGEILRAYRDHRFVMLRERTLARQRRDQERLHRLEGQLMVYLHLDEVIRIIRQEDHPSEALQARFHLTAIQAESILNMRLQSLRRWDEQAITQEVESLRAGVQEAELLLGDPERQRLYLCQEIEQLGHLYDLSTPLGARRTERCDPRPPILKEPGAVVTEDLWTPKDPVTVILSRDGWIRTLKGHSHDLAAIKYRDGDAQGWVLLTDDQASVGLLTSDGLSYRCPVDKLPKGKGLGEPLRLHVPIQDGVKILACTALHPTPSKAAWLLLTEDAKGFRILSEDLWPSKRGSRQIATTARPLLRALLLEDPALDRVALIGSHRKMVMLPLEGIPLMKRGKGVTLQRYRDPLTVLSDVVLLPSTQTALRWRVGGDRLRTEPSLARWMGKRGDAGAMAPIGFPRDNRFPAWEPETASRSTSSQEEA